MRSGSRRATTTVVNKGGIASSMSDMEICRQLTNHAICKLGDGIITCTKAKPRTPTAKPVRRVFSLGHLTFRHG